MYKKAVRERIIGLVIGAIIVPLWDAVMVWVALTEAPACWIIVAFLSFIAILIFTSFAQTNAAQKRMESEYPGDLEYDVDNCDQYVADKYFFLNGYLVDPYNGRMISYNDITSVTTYDIMDYETGQHSTKMVKIFTRDSFKPIRFENFNKGSVQNINEAIKNYECFVELLKAHVSDDVKFEKDTISNVTDIKRVLR